VVPLYYMPTQEVLRYVAWHTNSSRALFCKKGLHTPSSLALNHKRIVKGQDPDFQYLAHEKLRLSRPEEFLSVDPLNWRAILHLHTAAPEPGCNL